MRGQFTRRALLQLAASAGVVSTAPTGANALVTEAEFGDDFDWLDGELRNYAKTQEAPAEQSSDPDFLARWQTRSTENAAEYLERTTEEPGWKSHANGCATWGGQCTGDPGRYRDVDAYGFYGTVGERKRVAFYDREGARLSGHLWTPVEGSGLPGVVITNGSVQAPESLYWWAAQSLVAAGYAVFTYDPRGQGRSDSVAPDGTPGGNVNPDVFVTNQVDAIDFFRSTPDTPYEPNRESDRLDAPAPVFAHNPVHDRVDRSRIGVAGHSLGATGVSVVQGIQWPTGGENPVDAAVAWDNLSEAGSELAGYEVIPRVPAMGQAGDYGLTPTPHAEPPSPDAKAAAFEDWNDADVPAYQLVVRGGTHYEWSPIPTFPATSWEFGNVFADHYTVAWFDRWLKTPGEPGFHDADDRLLDDETWANHFSYHYRSKRAFADRSQQYHACDDVRAGCDAPTVPGRV